MSPTSYQTAPPRGGPSTLAARAPAANPSGGYASPSSVVGVVLVVGGGGRSCRWSHCPRHRLPRPAPPSSASATGPGTPRTCPSRPRAAWRPPEVAVVDRVVVRPRRPRRSRWSSCSRLAVARRARACSAWSGCRSARRPPSGSRRRANPRTAPSSASWSVSAILTVSVPALPGWKATITRCICGTEPLESDGDVQRPDVQQRLLDRDHEQVGRQACEISRWQSRVSCS